MSYILFFSICIDYYKSSFYYAYCRDTFGLLTANRFNIPNLVAKTNSIYGGLNYTAKRTIFVNGGLDPWSSLSVAEAPNPDSYSIVIEGLVKVEFYHLCLNRFLPIC
jgi:hypothetical protein